MRRGHWRWRGQSIEVRAYAGNGRRVTRTVAWQGGKRATENAADAVLAKLLLEIDAGSHQVGPEATFRALVEDWFASRARDWSPSTAAAHRYRIDAQVLPTLGDLRVRQMTAERVTAWLRDLPHAASTRYKAYACVRGALDHGVRIGWLPRNPALDVRPPRVPPAAVDAPDPADVARLLEAARFRDPELYLWLHLSATTGARRGEVTGLQWRDVEDSALVIRRAVVIGGGALFVRPFPKSRRPRRIALDTETLRLLAAHRKRCQEAALVCGVRLPASGFVFATEVDGSAPWRPDRATQAFGRLRARVGLRHVRLHDLRHFVATRLLDAGYAVADVAARLGHANGTTTTRLYAHAIPARDADLAATMAAIVRHDP